MAAVHDNLYALFSDAGPTAPAHAVEDLIARDELEMAAITYLRGRSITGESRHHRRGAEPGAADSQGDPHPDGPRLQGHVLR